MSVRRHFYQYMGPSAVGGYAKFFSPGTSTAKTTYTSDYSTAATLNSAGGIRINSSGFLSTYLLGDYDMLVYSSTGTQLTELSATGINPQEADSDTLALNLIGNGSFETDTNADDIPDGWTLTGYSGSTNELDSSDQHHGAKSMKFTSTGSGGGFIVNDDFIECSPVTPVVVTFALKSTATVRNLVEIIWYTSGQVEISDTDIYDEDTTNPTSWATVIGAAYPPSTARYCKIRIYGCHSSDSTAGTARFDNVVVQQGVGSPTAQFYTASQKDYWHGATSSSSYPASFDVDNNVTESTFESFGPTGSGATNIWTEMDDIPIGATAIVLRFNIQFTTGNTTGSNTHVYARPAGASDGINSAMKVSSFQYESVAASDVCVWIEPFVVLPLNSSRVFELTWNDNVATADISMYRVGYKMP